MYSCSKTGLSKKSPKKEGCHIVRITLLLPVLHLFLITLLEDVKPPGSPLALPTYSGHIMHAPVIFPFPFVAKHQVKSQLGEELWEEAT